VSTQKSKAAMHTAAYDAILIVIMI
jgi:hypothetical protein